MARRNFATALRAVARTLAHDGMPAAVDRRVRERIAIAASAPVRRTRWLIAGGLAAAATVATALFILVDRGPRAGQGIAGFELVEASADLRAEPEAGGVLAVLAGSATVHSDEGQMTIATRTPARVRKERAGIRVIAGVVDVSVAKRGGGEPPAHVDVSHGSIEVRGTRFRVEQRADGGQVRLEEGAIIFVADDGRQRNLRAGESLSWPLPPEPSPRELPAPEPPVQELRPREPVRPAQSPHPPGKRQVGQRTAPEPVPSREPIAVPPADATAEVEPLFREIAELRARGRYRQAAEAIERRLDEPGIRDATREIMSFELASILTYQLEDAARACVALARHMREYPRNPHAAAVERARADLGCHDEPAAIPPRRGK